MNYFVPLTNNNYCAVQMSINYKISHSNVNGVNFSLLKQRTVHLQVQINQSREMLVILLVSFFLVEYNPGYIDCF